MDLGDSVGKYFIFGYVPHQVIRAWRSPVGVLLLHQHHAVVLPLELSSSTSPSTLLDQDGGGVVRIERVLNAEVLSVQHLVIGDLNHGEYDSIIIVPSNASVRDLQSGM